MSSPCSTPFGINEWITRFHRLNQFCFRVLNAFRHQRMDHGDSILKQLIFQTVLNAFRHQRMDHWMHWSRRNESCVVLNAFRHQRMDHTGRDTSDLAQSTCAQRLSASTNGSRTARAIVCTVEDLCSTPFGINEWITALQEPAHRRG